MRWPWMTLNPRNASFWNFAVSVWPQRPLCCMRWVSLVLVIAWGIRQKVFTECTYELCEEWARKNGRIVRSCWHHHWLTTAGSNWINVLERMQSIRSIRPRMFYFLTHTGLTAQLRHYWICIHFIHPLTCDDVDVDECAVNNGGCSPVATCTNTPGSSTCTCLPGYSGDGFTCTGKSD